MLPSLAERPVTLNLLADTEIVVLRASAIVGAYEEAWDRLRTEIGAMPRNVMLVTGPSRSADIEQTLELGAHGPRRLQSCWWKMRDEAGVDGFTRMDRIEASRSVKRFRAPGTVGRA